ncbi:hypothetical protein PIB30_021804 [Stylosanthes scabra]|uniref:Uncharacterized protein n=1 Tax=Stylosanthes scabra TaxID=79078 RepID=A0ABU6WC19_9FABA|nr:hypothetical protein [Stylosanthes scabra]
MLDYAIDKGYGVPKYLAFWSPCSGSEAKKVGHGRRFVDGEARAALHQKPRCFAPVCARRETSRQRYQRDLAPTGGGDGRIATWPPLVLQKRRPRSKGGFWVG